MINSASDKNSNHPNIPPSSPPDIPLPPGEDTPGDPPLQPPPIPEEPPVSPPFPNPDNPVY